MSLPQRVLASVFVALLIAIGVVAVNGGRSSRGATEPAPSATTLTGPLLPPNLHAANFVLTDPAGRRVSLAQYRGRVVVLTFIHSLCKGICPLMVEQIKGALNDLPGQGRAVVALGISVEPAQDTPAHRLAFLKTHGLVRRLAYLSGPLPAMRKVWHAYAVAPQTAAGDDHSAFVFLIDQRGVERVGYPVSQLTPEDLAHDIRVLQRQAA